MCGITAILYKNQSNGIEIYESLLSIQHRGQDGAGISCLNENVVNIVKNKGLINNLCSNDKLLNMISNIYLAHTRYKTNNVVNSFQPFHLQNNLFNMVFCHNGNIINIDQLVYILVNKYNLKNIEHESDSYLLFLLIFHFLNEIVMEKIENIHIIQLSNFLQDIIYGSFSLIIGIEGYGIVTMKDKFGIRPLVYANNIKGDVLISSESCSINNISNYTILGDINPGETKVFLCNREIFSYKCQNASLSPCLFEYIYFSRLDSIINGVSVYNCRYLLGELLGKTLLKKNLHVDFIIPTPETSRVYAYGMSKVMNVPIQECIIKNRYINRTFIIEKKDRIEENIKRKFSVIKEVVKDKTVILMDDSIVRGNTSKNIIKLLKDSGVKSIIFCSGSPKIYNTNKYGIYIEQKEELITHTHKTNKDIANAIGANDIYYNSLEDVSNVINYLNPNIKNMEVSMFIDD